MKSKGKLRKINKENIYTGNDYTFKLQHIQKIMRRISKIRQRISQVIVGYWKMVVNGSEMKRNSILKTHKRLCVLKKTKQEIKG